MRYLSFSFFGFFLTFSLFLKFFMFVICLKIVSLHEWSTQSHVNPSIGLTNIRISDFSLCNKTPVIQDRSFCYLQSFSCELLETTYYILLSMCHKTQILPKQHAIFSLINHWLQTFHLCEEFFVVFYNFVHFFRPLPYIIAIVFNINYFPF